MNLQVDPRTLSPARQAALMDEARRRAIEARREALDAFWSAVGRGLRHGWNGLRRGLATTPARLRGAR